MLNNRYYSMRSYRVGKNVYIKNLLGTKASARPYFCYLRNKIFLYKKIYVNVLKHRIRFYTIRHIEFAS